MRKILDSYLWLLHHIGSHTERLTKCNIMDPHPQCNKCCIVLQEVMNAGSEGFATVNPLNPHTSSRWVLFFPIGISEEIEVRSWEVTCLRFSG